MAALNFPASPIVGQTYTANGKTWRWNGTAWLSYNTNEFATRSQVIAYNIIFS